MFRILFDPIKISYHNIATSKFRSFLTMLGIIIGVSSVIVVMSIGGSAQLLILDQVKGIGSNLVGVLPGASDEKGPPAMALGIVTTTLKYEDMLALKEKRNVPDIEEATAYVTGTAITKNKDKISQTNYQGVTANILDVEKIEVENGRFLLPQEDTNLSRVAVLGYTKAQDLFPNSNPVGKQVIIKDLNFTVVGTLKKRGSSGISNSDELIYLPLFTAQKMLLGIDYLNFIRAKIKDENSLNQAIDDIKKTLRERHKIKNPSDDDFSVRSTAQALSMLQTITNVLKYFLTSIASISLLVGGIGIMNIMLISVKQRIWEIGLRKAVGAKKIDVILQFLIESIFITLLGGILGIIFGIAISYLISIIIVKLGYNWQFTLSFQSMLLATGIAVLIGTVFGMYPAKKAGKVSPMEALRYE